MKRPTRLLILVLTLIIALLAVVFLFQRRMLYYPTHHRSVKSGLAPWTIDGRLVGYARTVDNPQNIWLFIHGNGGQAADRTYALPCFSPSDSVYVLEYPGYGSRPGSPSRASFDGAAAEAYRWLRKTYPRIPVCAVGESIGSGPVSGLARLKASPDKIVLVVPFDTLASVARDHFPLFPAGLLLRDRWDNVKALAGYGGEVEIYGAIDDRIIPVRHARELARSLPGAVFHEISGGHNDWFRGGAVRIHN